MDINKAKLIADYVNARNGCDEIVQFLYRNNGEDVKIIYGEDKVLPLSFTQAGNVINGLLKIIEKYDKEIAEIE